MRIIAGRFKGKSLTAPKGDIVRPTADRPKEALFSILESCLMAGEKSWNDLTFLDVFAGSGSMGIEALSRGAALVTFIEVNPKSLASLRTNLPTEENVKIIRTNALNPPMGVPQDIVFLDPPYAKDFPEKTLRALILKNWLDSNSLVIVEMDAREEYAFQGFEITQVRTYHRNKFVFLRKLSGKGEDE